MKINNLYQRQATKTSNKANYQRQATMASSTAKNSKYNRKISKIEIYNMVYDNRSLYIEWLDEIKKNGVDDKERVRNPMHEGSLIYTNKNGLYSTLWNVCVYVLQGNYDFAGIPRAKKVIYNKQRLPTKH